MSWGAAWTTGGLGQPELRTRLFLHAAWCQRALQGAFACAKGGVPSVGAPPFFVFDQLYIILFFSVSVKLKLSRAFNSPGRANLGRRLSLRWLAWMRCFMTVSERNVDAIFLGVPVMEVVCAFSAAIRLAWCMQWLHRSVGTWRSRLRCRGRHVRGFCVTGLPFCAGLLCLHLPVTFKAQGFKSRGGGTFVASALLASPSVQDFNSCSVVFVSWTPSKKSKS